MRGLLVFSLISLTKAFISASGMAEPATKKEKVCHSCGLDDQGQSTLLDAAGAAKAFAELPADLWTLEEKRLTRKFTAKNFLQAVEFVNKVAPVAEAARHHPDIHLTNYRDVELVLFTHSQGGLTPDDFALAVKLSRVGVLVSPKWAKENPERAAAEKKALSNDPRGAVGRRPML